MAWNEVSTMKERIKFVLEVESGEEGISYLCRKYDISRKTAYKWIKRYKEQGLEGMRERSSRPHNSPIETSWEWKQRIIQGRVNNPHRGPKKIHRELEKRWGGKVPARSTIGDILRRANLVKRRKRKVKRRRTNQPLTEPLYSNHVWAVDFKGWFRTKDGKRCDPLTISDIYSRFVLEVKVLSSQRYEGVRKAFERVFKLYGLPDIIRTDNGSPFASTGAGGLSKLSAWWLELGITPEFIQPGHPEQNGVHERMHRTLKEEATRPPSTNPGAQQRRFDSWRKDFNYHRPHEGIGMRTPSELYVKSTRAYTKKKKYSFDYPDGFKTRRVRSNGEIRWRGKKKFIGEAFIRKTVGVQNIENGHSMVFFYNVLLGNMFDNDKGGLRQIDFDCNKKSVT